MTTWTECCVSTGDPQGIGPEVAVKAARELGQRGDVRVVLVGAASDLLHAGAAKEWPHLDQDDEPSEAISIVPLESMSSREYAEPPSIEGGRRALAALLVALRRVQAAPARRALVTAPVSKAAVNLSGVPFDGHTGWIARHCGVVDPVMLFETPTFRVALATVHVALADVAQKLAVDGLANTLRVIDRDLRRRFGVITPTIAVLGLNPHAGEGGLLGREEIEVLRPAMAQVLSEGVAVTGPHSADTWFRPGFEGRADCTVAMYHDQGLLPVKCLAFGSAVNVTLGLPIVRTSVDHGTAFDIAGRDMADASSMVAAMDLSQRLLRGPSDVG